MFYFACNESLGYMKVSLFEISKKKKKFSRYSIFFLDAPVYVYIYAYINKNIFKKNLKKQYL